MIILKSILVYMAIGFLLNRVLALVVLLPLYERCGDRPEVFDKIRRLVFRPVHKPLFRLPAPWAGIVNQLYATLRWPENAVWMIRSSLAAHDILNRFGG